LRRKLLTFEPHHAHETVHGTAAIPQPIAAE
jgi:hypothetical protein